MLCPEVWKFKPPCSFSSNEFVKDNLFIQKTASGQYFNHHVSVTIPDTLHAPEKLINSISEDSDFYHISKLHASELVEAEFVDLFVRKGQLTLLSTNTKLDQDECVAIIPVGKLILSLTRKTYQQLGIDGKPAQFSRKNPNRYIVSIDLTAKYFFPGKKNYDNILQCLVSKPNLCFDVILAWEPPDEKICPSSIAAYFASKSYKVRVCPVRFKQKRTFSVAVPILDEESEPEDLTEWLGAFSLECNIPDQPDGFITSFHRPFRSTSFGQVLYLEWTGLITATKVNNLISEILSFVNGRSSWISLHVQGFEDSVISRGLRNHNYYTEGDYHYTIFFRDSSPALLCDFFSSTRRPISVKRRKRKR